VRVYVCAECVCVCVCVCVYVSVCMCVCARALFTCPHKLQTDRKTGRHTQAHKREKQRARTHEREAESQTILGHRDYPRTADRSVIPCILIRRPAWHCQELVNKVIKKVTIRGHMPPHASTDEEQASSSVDG
jgi:hypothetical protein